MQRILVANRGEIAVRIIRTIKKMGLEAVALYNVEEKNALHTRMADTAVNLGSGLLAETFLNINLIISIAKDNKCDAIHPGYGFLSENYLFAKACEENGIIFIGPSSAAIRQMGSKSEARTIARKAGIPVLEEIEISNDRIPSEVKFPLIIKAALGGGGKGMKIVKQEKELSGAIENARREALSYFNDDKLIIEPYIGNARHIEVQILGDNFGNVIHLFERECSIQRNHQKVIEEAPAVSISNELLSDLHHAAISLAKEIKYTNAGTIEFLVSENSFYFLEMNTRIQVEHPVTEAITGIDIVEEQIAIAQNKPLPEYLKNIKSKGHAIEVRICAENPFENFRPSSGSVEYLNFPQGPRVDTFLESQTRISANFDSMLAKLIVQGQNRSDAILNLKDALSKTIIHGIETNITYLTAIASNSLFSSNEISTDFIKINHESLVKENYWGKLKIPHILPVAAFVYHHFIKKQNAPLNLWQFVGPDNSMQNLNIIVDGVDFMLRVKKYSEVNFEILSNNLIVEIEILNDSENILSLIIDGKRYDGFYSGLKRKHYDIYEINSFQYKILCPQVRAMAGQFIKKEKETSKNHFNQIVSPLFGKVTDIKVSENDFVKKGDILLTIESMKTENHILSPGEGIVTAIKVYKGMQVEENFELITLNPVFENEYISNRKTS